MTKQLGKISLGIISAIIIGIILHGSGNSEYSSYIKPFGLIFINLLKMIIIPLVFSSIFMSVVNLGHPQNLGRLGKRTITYFLATTLIAVVIGISFGILFRPGADAQHLKINTTAELTTDHQTSSIAKPKNDLVSILASFAIESVPANPVRSMVDNNMLQIIVFALIIGVAALIKKDETQVFVGLMKNVETISHEVTKMIMKLAPYGVFALLLDVVAGSGFSGLQSLAKYVGIVICGLIAHFSIVLAWVSFKTKQSPIKFIKAISPSLVTAFTTSSSAATLPVTMECVTENLKVKHENANFVLPLGATINMDGTALYIAVATCFIAQIYDVHLGGLQLLLILVTTVLASVGAAAIPGASMVTIGIVLSAVHLPMEGIQVIIAVDRILDMFRTTVNVFGDVSVVSMVDKDLESP